MEILTPCVDCGQPLQVPHELAGAVVRCNLSTGRHEFVPTRDVITRIQWDLQRRAVYLRIGIVLLLTGGVMIGCALWGFIDLQAVPSPAPDRPVVRLAEWIETD